MPRPRPFALLTIALAALVGPPAAAVAPVPAVAAASGPARVRILSLAYAPARIRLAAPGMAVRWTNVTSPDRAHDVISSLPGYFGSDLLGAGERFTVRFAAAGTFGYICSIHDTMLGRVEVAPLVTVEGAPGATRLRITLGTAPFARDAAYRWSVFLQGPGDAAPVWRRTTRAASIALPVGHAGEWSVMVRVRHRATGTASSDSPRVTVSVPPA